MRGGFRVALTTLQRAAFPLNLAFSPREKEPGIARASWHPVKPD